MQIYIDQWEAAADQRALFLTCYRMMTQNMLAACSAAEPIQGGFHDSVWVDRLLHRFADYYFIALDAYERDPVTAPIVWQLAHNSTRDPQVWPVQHLLLGVNAHINYDLVLTLVELLQPEWESLDAAGRQQRYRDYMQVNTIITDTIDAVQEEVLAPAMPSMDWVDRLFGRLDEWMISSMLTSWRETVWDHAVTLLENPLPDRQTEIVQDVETRALQTARMIGFRPTAR